MNCQQPHFPAVFAQHTLIIAPDTVVFLCVILSKRKAPLHEFAVSQHLPCDSLVARRTLPFAKVASGTYVISLSSHGVPWRLGVCVCSVVDAPVKNHPVCACPTSIIRSHGEFVA